MSAEATESANGLAVPKDQFKLLGSHTKAKMSGGSYSGPYGGPQNQYTFSSSAMKQRSLADQGCDGWSSGLFQGPPIRLPGSQRNWWAEPTGYGGCGGGGCSGDATPCPCAAEVPDRNY